MQKKKTFPKLTEPRWCHMVKGLTDGSYCSFQLQLGVQNLTAWLVNNLEAEKEWSFPCEFLYDVEEYGNQGI